MPALTTQPIKVHAKVKVTTTSGPYPGKLPVRTRTPEPAPRPRSVVRDILAKPERAPTKAELYPGPKPPQRTRDPVPPSQLNPKKVVKSQTESDMKKLYPGPKLPERTRPPEPPRKRGSSVKSERQPSMRELYPGPKLPERTRDPVPPPPSSRGSVKKVMSILGRSSRNSSTTSVSTKQGQGKPRTRHGSDVWDDKGSSGHHPRRRVSWYSFRASPSSNSLCDLSVCDMACGARHEGQSLPPPSLPSLPSLHSGLTGHTSQTTNGYANGYTYGYANGHTNGYADDNTVNGHADENTANGHADENTANGHAKPPMQDRQVMTDAYLLTPIESDSLGGLGLDLFVHERHSRELRGPLEQGREEQSASAKLSAVGAQSVAGALSHLSLTAVRAPSLKRVPEASPVSTMSSLPARRSSLIAPLSPIMAPKPKPAEDITVTLWTRDGAASPGSVPCETDSESEPDEEPAVTIFPRASSRLSRTPSVVISEHNYDFAARESVSTRNRYSTASGYSTAMSGYSTALTGYSTAYEDLPSPGSADSGGYGNYNLYGAMPVTTSYNQFAPPRSAVNYTAAGRQRPNSWHVSSTPSFPASPVQPSHLIPAVPERDAKFLQPPDQYFVDDVQPVGPRPSVELDIKPGFRVEFDEARRGRPF